MFSLLGFFNKELQNLNLLSPELEWGNSSGEAFPFLPRSLLLPWLTQTLSCSVFFIPLLPVLSKSCSVLSPLPTEAARALSGK